MAFGFPAYHEAEIKLNIPPEDVVGFMVPIIESLSWSIREYSQNHMLITSKVGMKSWGEKIRVTILPSGMLGIRSECSLTTQCFDWGKNEKNVNRLLVAINSMK
tara:strand:- start:76 stop:387 length:312 start_codon:yes stop_codon:yes gene_type:complete